MHVSHIIIIKKKNIIFMFMHKYVAKHVQQSRDVGTF